MTNTLHRFGDAESFYDDYVVFAIPSRGKNDKGSVPKLKQFLEMALPFKPVNLGDALNGGALRPRRDMSPTAHWNRDMTPDFRGVIDGLTGPTTVANLFGHMSGLDKGMVAIWDAVAFDEIADLQKMPREVITRGLTLEQAQAHCSDPETSSSTATGTHAQARTAKYGPWFDGYEEE